MIEMHVGAIALDKASGEPIILLSDAENKCALPIWVGAPEARAISFAVKKITPARPLTHDLLLSVIKQFGYSVKEVHIDQLDERTYKATVVLSRQTRRGHEAIRTVDARPSDAIALATIAEAKLLVAPAIVMSAGLSTEVELEEDKDFKKFLQGVKASDFKIDRNSK